MLSLKHYQERAIGQIETYAKRARQLGPKVAFIAQTDKPYKSAPNSLAPAPYVCIQMPTGGGKTLVACHSVGRVFTHYLHRDAGLVVWFVPWESILTQTLAALRERSHPYRQVLEAAFPKGVRVVTLKEALFGALKPHDLANNLCVVVSTLDAFRVEKKEGRKVYEVNGYLMTHFESLPPELEAQLERDESGIVVCSLANVIRLHQPMVVLDEGHNAQTTLSFDMLARLNPAFMLEYTATPRGHSNVLVNIPATDLKEEAMVKLPLWLQNRTDWRAALRDAKARRDELEEEAQAERKATGEHVRPILLIQAEPRSKSDSGRVTVERVKEFLLNDLKIPPQEVKIKTGERDELAGVDLFSPRCPVRTIITVYALKEGWDCNFAYVLASVASLGQRLAVEQLIGRVLRLPQARRKQVEALNYAYVYTVSPRFHAAAKAVKEGLVSNGYAPDDVRELPERERPSLTVHRTVKDADASIPLLALLGENSVWQRLTWGHLIGGFDLTACNPLISFTPPDEEQAAWIDVEEHRVVQKQAHQLPLALAFREKALNADELVHWLDWRLRTPYVGQKAKRAFFQQVIAHLVAQRGGDFLAELTHHRFYLLATLSETIDRYIEEHAHRRLLEYKGAGRLGAAGEVPYPLPESMALFQSHAAAFRRHLFDRAADMNDEESVLAEKLDALDNLAWWYRNRENEDLHLPGWWGRFYPDFVARTTSGVCLALEYKGEHLVTAQDAERKEQLGKIWDDVSGGQCRFWMATVQNMDAVIAEIQGL
jgi:hypothetical protein